MSETILPLPEHFEKKEKSEQVHIRVPKGFTARAAQLIPNQRVRSEFFRKGLEALLEHAEKAAPKEPST